MSMPQEMTDANLRSIPSGLSGIYAIYHNFDGEIDTAYVGRAKGTPGSCIKTRLQKHFSGQDKQRIGSVISTSQKEKEFFFSYEVIETYEELKRIEKSEIVNILPAGNVQRNFKIEDLGIE